MNHVNKTLPIEQSDKLLHLLESRFEKNKNRHPALEWNKIGAKLQANPQKLWSLQEMERTGGEPDILYIDGAVGEYIFYDCSVESPKGRRSICYDKEGLLSRKSFQPHHNTIDMANEMGIELLTEDDYRVLQKFGSFDTKTSSWLQTPANIRQLGGALFADRRYNQVFVYHNTASSYFSGRGFRGLLRV